ncbi:signal recognition particle protein [Corynebacterium sp. H78]|uniref:signal recognition particle protein n=1 Tax=Corynebacterium sp. H78 TaxID=3133417 RepID=UPI0030A8EB24
MFESLSDRLTGALKGLGGKGKLTEADINATAREIRLALLEADVSLQVVRAFVKRIKERANEVVQTQTVNPANKVIEIVNEELVEILGGETRRLNLAKNPPTVIMLAGLQGAGKTTLAGKLAKYLSGQGHTPVLVACDLQRPGAVQQLEIVAERAGVPCFAPFPGTAVDSTHEMGTSQDSPVDAAFRGMAYARQHRHDVVIVDTAGRLGIDEVLMQQASDIREAINPDEVLFVIDAMIGQDAVETAKAFRDGVDFTGVVLTKLDGDARGGAALSIREVTGKPILFASTGEKLEDFDVFHPDRMASRILGMGDLKTLMEVATKEIDQEQAQKTAQKIGSGELTLDDFLEQMMMVRKMGPIGNILKMLPGGSQMSEMADMVDEKQLDRIQAIIRGMTPQEREDPKILNASRRKRIANGSGVTVSEVNQLIERFFEAKKMMSHMAGQFGMPGGRPSNRKNKKGRKGKKGRNKGRGPTPPKAMRQGMGGGMPGMPGMPGMGGMPGMPGGQGMPDLAELQKQMKGQMPPGMEDIDLSQLDFGKGNK